MAWLRIKMNGERLTRQCVRIFFFVTSQITLFLLIEKKAHIENNEENTKEQSGV